MRITMFLLLFSVIQVVAKSSYSQSTKLSLNLNDVSIEHVLDEIENQSEFYFLYNQKLVNVDRKVDVNTRNNKISDILANLFEGEKINYLVMDRQIVLSPQYITERVDVTRDRQAQEIVVTGIVSDQDGNPLPGVTIIIKGTITGSVTNADGNYSIEVKGPESILVFSFVGREPQEIQVGNQTTINVVLAKSALAIDELVVVGYGLQKKINLTGAVDVVSEEQIKERAVTTVTEALQGVSPNLNITATAYSSEPGGKMDINIRGAGSLTGDDSPYVLVDGIPMDINSINPNDIESITILKDAAASAIYGARAPYGVILITTKRGEFNQKVIVEYSNNISFSSPIGLPHMANALQYATAHDQSSVNAGLAPNFTPENYDRMERYMAGELTEETWLKDDGSDWMGNGIWSIAGNGNNDWMYIYYDDMVMRQKHDISVRGGGEKNSFYISAGSWDQPGELSYGDESYKRSNVTANILSNPTDWLTFNLNTKYISDQNQYFNTRQGWDRGTMYHNFFRTNVFRPLYLPNGEFSNISYIPMLNGGKENQYGSQYILSLGTTIEPIENWKTKIQYNHKNNGTRTDDNSETVYGSWPDGSQYVIAYPISSFESTFSSEIYTLFNIVSSYHKTINGHYFYLMGGYENESSEYNSLWGKKNDILTPSVPSISTSTGEYYVDDVKFHWATEGFFGRFNYNYREKYLFEFNARYDGSSKFEESKRWGFFPSLSVGYNISKEDFWSSIEPYIYSLKIRGSWGSLGNQNVPNYLYLSTLGIGTNLSWIMGDGRPNYTLAPGLVSADLTWETSTTMNVGVDVGFLNGRLNTTFDVFNRTTSEMFGPAEALPITLGTSPPRANNATLQTRGFELAIWWRDNVGTDLSYNVRATLADNVSTVTEYNNPTKTLSTWYEGAELGEIWGLTTDGIYQSDTDAANGPNQSLFWPTWGAGDIHYEDSDGDGVITRGTWTADDAGDYSVIGNNMPRFLFGLSAGLQWKGFDFNMFWQGVLKRDYAFSGGDMSFFGFNGHQWWGMNVWEQTVDYWRPADETNRLGPNTDAYYAKPYLSQQDYKNKEPQTRYMQNAAYVRLKNINLGYTIPSNITERVKISHLRIFISGENLLTITPLTKLIDPEALTNWGWGVGKVHPLRKVYALGINITF